MREYQLNYTYMGACPEAVGRSSMEILMGGALVSHTIVNLIANSLYVADLTAFNDGGSSDTVSFNFTTATSGTT